MACNQITRSGEDWQPASFRDSCTILLVEDQTFVRQAAASALRLHGYTVLTAENGQQALEICRTTTQVPDLLVSDMIMPGMGGNELADAFQAMHPQARVLLMTGYAEELAPFQSVAVRRPCLRKPFSIDGLINAVGELLAAHEVSATTSAGKM